MYSLNDIKSWFKTGKFPTEDQFAKAWESFWHKAEKISISTIDGLQNILSAKADRDMVDSQINDLRLNKENVGVAQSLVNTHANASDAHQSLFDLKANEADVYHREVIDSWFDSHESDVELHFTEEEKIKLTNLGKYVSGLAVTPSSDGSGRLDLVVNRVDPQVAAESASASVELPLVTAGCNGLMSSGQKSVVDGLSQGNAVLNVGGTPSATWQLSSTSGPKLKNSGNVFELRNAEDSAYTDLTLNNLTIKGNVVQDGGSFITNAETVETKDNLILLNKGEVGAGVSKGIAGLEIDRGTQENYKIVFDESDDRFKAGTGNDLWSIMLRDNEANLAGGALLSWDATTKRAKTRSEGAGSGLDADLLDGKQGSDYALKTDLTAISWDYVTGKPATATRWPSWDEITNRPTIPAIPSLSEAEGSGVGYLITGVSGHTVSRRGIGDGDIPVSIARTNQIPSLAGYATQTWVSQYFSNVSEAITKTQIVAKLNEGGAVTMSQYWDFTAGAGNSSDIRLKKNLEKIEDAGGILESLTAYRYEFKNTGKKSAGVIAQDVQKVFPEAVHEGEDGFLSVESYPLLALLIEENKRKSEKIRILEDRLTEIEKIIDAFNLK